MLPAPGGGLLLRIPAMDCPVEEGQIRRALERFADVDRPWKPALRSLRK